jgi:hypothetical protein
MARDPILAGAATDAARHFDGKGGFKNEGRKNLYQCERDPSHLIVTVDLEAGVTPFLIECERCKEEGHRASMKSAMYHLHAMTVATHEWYRPDSLAGFSRWTRDHLEKGGLILRKRESISADVGVP